MNYHHQPVLLKEVIELLNPQAGENFVDATLGGGGYSLALMEQIAPAGKLLAIDLDHDALKNFQFLISNSQTKSKFQNPNIKPPPLIPPPLGEGRSGTPQKLLRNFWGTPRVRVVHGNFSQIDKIVRHYGFEEISGIVADLGLSSQQLNGPGRGMSFQSKELLDMRFDQSSNAADARFILKSYEPKRLEKIFRDYGEEKFSRQIAKQIQNSRLKNQEIKYTADLYQIIEAALPKPFKHKAADSARRIFQALRIEVNHELENLREFLPKAFDLLKVGGRLAVVSFHSLEDRMVKQYFSGLNQGCVCPPEFPICQCGKSPKAKLLTKKPVIPSAQEQQQNPRSKSAKLRAVVKI